MSEKPGPKTERVRTRRMHQRGAYDRATIDAILDAQPLAHVGYLRDGGRYRFRRHASFVVDAQAEPAVRLAPHRAHWQPLDYNALHGGIQRAGVSARRLYGAVYRRGGRACERQGRIQRGAGGAVYLYAGIHRGRRRPCRLYR